MGCSACEVSDERDADDRSGCIGPLPKPPLQQSPGTAMKLGLSPSLEANYSGEGRRCNAERHMFPQDNRRSGQWLLAF